MYSTEEQVRLVQLRIKKLQHKREKQLMGSLSALCIMLTISLMGTFNALTHGGSGAVQGLYGATMMLENAGGYVLVGILAFALAVVITVLCIRHKEKTKENDQSEEDEEK